MAGLNSVVVVVVVVVVRTVKEEWTDKKWRIFFLISQIIDAYLISMVGQQISFVTGAILLLSVIVSSLPPGMPEQFQSYTFPASVAAG